MAERIVCDWATEMDSANKDTLKFTLVFLFKCKQLTRFLSTKMSLVSLLCNMHTSMGDANVSVVKYLQCNASKVLIIFDGLDELNQLLTFSEDTHLRDIEAEGSFFDILKCLISGKLLSGAHVLVTSRPSAAMSIADDFHRVVEILGFSEDGVHEYVSKYFSDDEEYAKKVFAHLKTNLNIYSLCSIPVSCRLICQVYDDSRTSLMNSSDNVPLLKTVTSVYVKVLCRLVKHHHHTKNAAILSVKVEDIVKTELEWILNIARMALDGIINRKLMFSETDLEDYGLQEKPKILFCFVTCIQEKHGNADDEWETFYIFHHLTIQEFMAALSFLVQQTVKDVNQDDRQSLYYTDGRLEIVYRFFSGFPYVDPPFLILSVMNNKMACMDAVVQAISKLKLHYHKCDCNKKQQRELAKTLMHMALETQEREIAKSVMEIFREKCIDLSGTVLSAPDLFAMGFLLANLDPLNLTSVVLDQCNIDDIGAQEIAVYLDKLDYLRYYIYIYI